MKYTCHSGGAKGSDTEWKNECNRYGIITVVYSFSNHSIDSPIRTILSKEELDEGFEHAKIAAKSLKRSSFFKNYYIRNLISRNWFQVKNSEAVYAIGEFLNSTIVNGGTGWAVQMAIDSDKPVFVYDQNTLLWNEYIPKLKTFQSMLVIPKLTSNFAGIGTRKINDHGKNAIKEILKYNMENI